jgi:acetyltransferase
MWVSVFSRAQVETIMLRNGLRASIRRVAPADAALMQQFVRELTPEARRNRFFGSITELSARQLDRMTRFEQPGELGLVATCESAAGERIVGVAQLACGESHCAELAVVIADSWHRQGLAKRLLARLLAHGKRTGLCAIVGVVLAENWPMLALAAQLGFSFTEDRDPSVVRIEKRFGPPARNGVFELGACSFSASA